MRTLASLRFLTASLFCGAGLPAQEPASDPLRFLHVEKYQGRLLISTTGEGPVDLEGNHYEYQVDRHADIALELTATLPDNPVVQRWHGTILGKNSASIHEQVISVPNGGGCFFLQRWDGAGALIASEVHSAPGDADFQLATDGGPLAATFSFTGLLDMVYHTHEYGGPGCNAEDYSGPSNQQHPYGGAALPDCPTSPRGFPITCMDFPESGVLIRQTWDFFAKDYFGTTEGPDLHHSITLELDGEVEDLEVVVTPGDYENWLPEARASETEEGNTIAINAKLQKKGGGTPEKRAEQFIFELTQVSQEPGVCMNYPVSGAKDSPDLAFTPENNQGSWMPLPPSGDSRIETTIGSYVDSPPAVLSSFDWGAFGAIKVLAVLEGGRVIEGHLDGDGAVKEIRLPKRDQNSRIGDPWKNDNAGAAGKADDADDETIPAGDGDAGDGLTLYEEYRGFYMDSTGPAGHVDGDPRRKDLFVNDKTASGMALQRFRGLTGLAVHDDLDENYLGESRVINLNHGAGPHVVDQHALIVEKAELKSDEAGEATGGPGLPRSVSLVLIGDTLDPAFLTTLTRGGKTHVRSNHLSTVVHELLHACNVYHHGEGDQRPVHWSGAVEDGRPVTHENFVQTIRVFRENGEELRPTELMQVYLGMKGGQHSGVEDCVMRYDCSQAHTGNGSANVRLYLGGLAELIGAGLCSTKTGTGVNAASPTKPWPRYGDATAGCCKHQICVNDKQSHAPDTSASPTACGAGGGDEEPPPDPAAGRGGAVAAPVVFLSANGARKLDVHPGDPVLFVSEIIASDAVGPGSPLEISAPGERWHKWLRLEARDATGLVFSWPLHLATEGDESVLLDAENGGLAAWWTHPEETPALPTGVYEIRAILDSSAAPTGFSGVKHSAPVKITVAPLPSPAPPGFEVERLLLRARHYLVEEDLAKASAAIDELFALDPEVIGGLTLQGALFQAAGQSAEALQSFDAALDLCNSRRPNAPEPPFELLRLHSQALDQAAPLTEVVSNSPSFRRGDSDGDGVQNLSDAVHTLGYLFLGNPTTVLCAKAADADDTGKLNISDPVFLLSHLFLGSREPPAPFPECGAEATVDELECESQRGCSP